MKVRFHPLDKVPYSVSEKRNTCIAILETDTPDDLDRRITELEIDVPPRAQDPTTDDCEQWQMQHLLRALCCASQLPLPVRLYKREAPDFVLETGNLRIGVETTEAINSDYVRAQMHPAAQEDGVVVDPSLYKWGNQGRPNSQIREEAGRKHLSGDGWVGDSVEWEFGQSIIAVVRRKHLKLRSHYARYDSDRLLVYYNQLSPVIDIDKARVYAAKCLVDYWNQFGFDTVYVHKYNWVLYFTRDASGILYEFPRSDAPLGINTDTWERLESVEKLYLKLLEHESDFMQLISISDPEPEPDHLLVYKSDLQNLHHEWHENRARDLLESGYSGLLQPPDQIRLRTASEVAACPAALDLFRGGVLEYVFRAVAEAVADVGATEIPRLHGTMASRCPEFATTVTAVLRYLSTFEHITHWARDSRSCSTILDALHHQA